MKRIIFIVLLAAVLIFTGCSFSFTTANITDAAMTSNVINGEPVDSVKGYSPDTPELFAVAVLNNAPDDTIIRFVWSYLTGPQVIYEVEMNSEGESGIYVIGSITNEGLWPEGKYTVEIYIDDREEPDATIGFSIK